jgi:hypothetical protein
MASLPALPLELRVAASEIEAKLRRDAAVHRVTLEAARRRLLAGAAQFSPDDLGHFKHARACERLLQQNQRALDALAEATLIGRLHAEIAACASRFHDLEEEELARRRALCAAAQQSEMRFLPQAPVSAQGASATKTLAEMVAHELRVKFGVEERAVDLIAFDTCKKCGVSMQHNTAMQQLVCPTPGCGFWKRFADMTSAGLAFGEELEFCKYTYYPISRLDGIMQFAEAGEACVVPTENLVAVMRVLFCAGVKPEDVTISKVRKIVYETKCANTEHTVQIYSRLTGRTPYRLSSFEKDKIRIMFYAEAPHYRRFCGTRSNNKNYPYTYYKDCELLGYWEMLEAPPLLRGKPNREEHDAIQQQIDAVLDWEFIPTVEFEDNLRVRATLKKCKIGC